MIFILFSLIAVLGVYGYARYQETREQNKQAQAEIERLSNPDESAKDAESKLIDQVKQVAAVPDDEQPILQRVDDASKFGVPLVENGDIVFLYIKARRQIIYRPSTNKVIVAVNLPADNAKTQDESSKELTDPEQ